jgi:hypothetical protein
MACMDQVHSHTASMQLAWVGFVSILRVKSRLKECSQSRTEKNILLIFGNLFPLEIKRLIAHIHFDLARYETVVSYLSLCLCKRTVRCQLPVHYIRHTYGTQPSNRSIL